MKKLPGTMVSSALSSLCLLCLLFFCSQLMAAQQHSIDATTKAETWSTQADGVTFSLTQILPDQARAFYVNRGFSLEQIEDFATACVYMVVLRNDDAPGVIHYELQNWQVEHNGLAFPPLQVAHWMEIMQNKGVSKPALIAFRWAQFPPEQEYEPGGDWNQGMLTLGIPAGDQATVTARWNINENQYEGKLTHVRCAK